MPAAPGQPGQLNPPLGPTLSEPGFRPVPPPAARQVLRFEKTPCFGTCPVYTVELDSTGEARFSGLQNTATQGEAFFRISPRRLRGILRRARQLGFWEMQPKYDATITDIPSTILTLDDPIMGRKRVEARANFPESLGSFLQDLEALWKSRIAI